MQAQYRAPTSKSRVPTRLGAGEGNTAQRVMRVLIRPAGVIDLVHACPRKKPMAELVERRTSAKRNPDVVPVAGTQRPAESESGLDRIRAAARKDKALRFNNLFHHMTLELLAQAYHALKRNAAPGVDGIDWYDYGKALPERLKRLHERLQQGSYRPQPVKRQWIDKAAGGKRPLGVTSTEDKIVQQALVFVLEPIYETEFLGFSYGSRPGRSQHNALDALYMAITTRKVSFVLDMDIKGFFDAIDQTWLFRFLEHRIADRRILHLIEHTLQAGVMDGAQWTRSGTGVPQGAVISPLLANLYLHDTLYLWTHRWRRRCARGEVYIVRYVDDAVLCFQYRDDAARFHRELAQRLERFGLRFHPDKTRLLEFGRFAYSNRKARGAGKPKSFTFLGFTHLCSRRLSDGKFTVKRVTIAKRQRAKLKELRKWLYDNRAIPVADQGRYLNAVLRGVINYFGVPGNWQAVDAFRRELCRSWLRALRRRSQKARKLTWETFKKVVRRWIPSVKVVHPYPNQRLCV